MEERFKIVQKEFEQLRDKFRKKEISEPEFKKMLKELRLQDQDGRFWTIGAQTGKWYYFDGSDWIESKPPTLQDKKAICIYCGFENDLENESCAYCGESFKKEEKGEREEEGEMDFVCPKCGRKLDKYSFFCPDCDITETPEEKEWETGEILEPEKEEDDIPPQKLESGTSEEEEGDQIGQVLRYIQPFSMLLFLGSVGLLFGIILGAFVGATEFLKDGTRIVPAFLSELQGSLIGGIFYGLLGGIFGFIFLGLLGFLIAHFFNMVFSLIGGLKINVDKTP